MKSTGKNRICISPYEPLPEPKNIAAIKDDIQKRWSMTSLLDVLKETDLRIDFTSKFSSLTSRQRLNQAEVQKRLILILYTLGTNAGVKRMADSRHNVGYRELLRVKNQFVHKNALRATIRDVVNATLQTRNPQIWGEVVPSPHICGFRVCNVALTTPRMVARSASL